MGDISPVLASYLGGYQSSSENIAKAHNYGLQKAHLDEMIKQFQTEMEHKNKQLDLQQQIHNLTKQHDEAEYMKALPEMLAKHPELVGTNPNPVPGIQSTPGTSPDGLPMNIPGMTMQNLPPAPGAPVTMNSPYGDMHLNMPKSEGQSKIEDALAEQKTLFPGQVGLYKATVGDSKTKELEQKADALMAQLGMKDQALKMQQYIADQKSQGVSEQHATQLMVAELRGQLANTHMWNSLGFSSPEELQQGISKAVTADALGFEPLKNNPSPIIKQRAENAKNAMGLGTFTPDSRKKATDALNGAQDYINKVGALQTTLKPPSNLVGQAGNVLADTFGISGLSPYKSTFDMIQTDLLPKLDVTLGLTPGALSRSPKLLDKIKSLTPLPGDKTDVIQTKLANGVDLYLTAANKEIAALPVEHRKLIWQSLIDANPELLQSNPLVAKKLIQAKTTGNFIPGTLVKDWVTSAGGKF